MTTVHLRIYIRMLFVLLITWYSRLANVNIKYQTVCFVTELRKKEKKKAFFQIKCVYLRLALSLCCYKRRMWLQSVYIGSLCIYFSLLPWCATWQSKFIKNGSCHGEKDLVNDSGSCGSPRRICNRQEEETEHNYYVYGWRKLLIMT